MRFLRKSFLAKVFLSLGVILVLQSAVLPNYLYALTSGPHMPEYTSYESPGATDMVNLSTGDFSFSLPILDVPGPEGGFSLPLSYHAGIGLEQQASWVGLGWTMNPGAITRNIVGFPDDANGEIQNVTVQDLVGLRGWDVSLAGIGRFGWNNQQGHYGHLSILSIVNADWHENHYSVGVIGFNVSDKGFKVDPVQLQMGITAIVTLCSSAYSTETKALSMSALKQSIVEQAIITGAIDFLISSMNSGGTSPAGGYWKYSRMKKTNWALFIASGFTIKKKKFRTWLDKTRYEEMYGILNLGNAPTDVFDNSSSTTFARLKLTSGGGVTNETLYNYRKTVGKSNQGAASDIAYQDAIAGEYQDVNNPVFLATDNFHVAAGAITGSIVPYRLETGSVSMPREMTGNHLRLAPVKYLPNDFWQNSSAHKVPFVYRGQLSSNYFHHVGGQSSISSPQPYLGINWSSVQNPPQLTYDLNDFTLKSQRIRANESTTKKISQSNHVEWLTNSEIRNGTTYSNKFLDFLSATGGVTSDRYKFRTRPTSFYSTFTSHTSSFNYLAIPMDNGEEVNLNPTPSTVNLIITFYNDATAYANGQVLAVADLPGAVINTVDTNNHTFAVNNSALASYSGKIADIQVQLVSNSSTPNGLGALNTLGGFSITGGDGATYHFALPIYDYDLKNEVHDVAYPTTKRSIIKRSEPFANTWLVTAITGADYVDYNGNGMVDENDWGYWVKFNYGLYTNDYGWRVPYSNFTKDLAGGYESASEGKKQLIYLNSIETRSHVALFLKSARMDGKSVVSSSGGEIYPLKLDEIVLLSRSNYNKLTGQYGIAELSGKLSNLCMSSQYTSNVRTFINLNCEKRVVFNYDYSLCQYTPNSYLTFGKLTLNSISIKGRSDIRLIPDYKFEYANNPNYNVDRWDGWGLYNANGSGAQGSHVTSQTNPASGSEWALTKIINPLGSETIINYERDTYSAISDDLTTGQAVTYSSSNTSGYNSSNTINVAHNGLFLVGDKVKVEGFLYYQCYGATSTSYTGYSGTYNITAVTANSITLDGNHIYLPGCLTPVFFSSDVGSVTKVLKAKIGGDIRVASIILNDEFGGQNKISYSYNKEDGITSSGVVAQEPEFIGSGNNIPGYPNTGVIYGRVTVLNGNGVINYGKQVYEFETPSSTHYALTRTELLNQTVSQGLLGYSDNLTIYENKLEDRSGKIGTLKSVKSYNPDESIAFSTTLTYTEGLSNRNTALQSQPNNYQGIYSSGAIMVDMVTSGSSRYHKVNRTTVLQYPWVVETVTKNRDGFSSSSKSLSWDFKSGAVEEQLETSSLGLNIKTVTRFAYNFSPFSELGPKAENNSNRNMLSQVAATYSYRTDTQGNLIGLLSANLQLWKKDWANYRYHNGTQYVETPEETISANNRVWRKGASYSWKGSYASRQADGSQSLTGFGEHSFLSTPGSQWQYGGEYVRFDHFGMPLESKDWRNVYAATKMGYDNKVAIANASNAQFNEIAFSSAEDEIPNIGYFGGEVAKGSGTVVRKSAGADAHTGDCALSLSTGYGFVYKPQTLAINRTYRANAWTNSTNGRLYYKLNGSADVLSAAPTQTGKAGWYKLTLDIPIGATLSSLEVGVKSASGTVLFDDFRFQPADAAMVCYVYLPSDYSFIAGQNSSSWVLDNDNLYTRYETTENGLISRVYAESFLYGEKLITETKNDFKRFYINQ